MRLGHVEMGQNITPPVKDHMLEVGNLFRNEQMSRGGIWIPRYVSVRPQPLTFFCDKMVCSLMIHYCS